MKRIIWEINSYQINQHRGKLCQIFHQYYLITKIYSSSFFIMLLFIIFFSLNLIKSLFRVIISFMFSLIFLIFFSFFFYSIKEHGQTQLVIIIMKINKFQRYRVSIIMCLMEVSCFTHCLATLEGCRFRLSWQPG